MISKSIQFEKVLEKIFGEIESENLSPYDCKEYILGIILMAEEFRQRAERTIAHLDCQREINSEEESLMTSDTHVLQPYSKEQMDRAEYFIAKETQIQEEEE